jgi:hypothetical protein
MKFNHAQKVATAHAVTDLLAADGVDTREDLHTWLDHQANRTALRTEIYGVLGEYVSCRRGTGGSGVGAPVSGAARNASIM